MCRSAISHMEQNFIYLFIILTSNENLHAVKQLKIF